MTAIKHRDAPSGIASGASEKLYERDFFTWTREQGALLRAGRTDEADLQNIAEEIETLGRSEAAALEAAYRLVSLHLLKLMFQGKKATRSWRITIVRERLNIVRLLRQNPGLKPKRLDLFTAAYADARKEAAAETGIAGKTFPSTSPFTIHDVEKEDYWPTADGETF